MTMLNDKGVKKLAYDLNLITPFNQANLQPNSYDLTLGNEYIRDKQFFIENEYLLQPNDFILATTVEKINMPSDLAGHVEGKSSTGRIGLMIHSTAGFIDAGFQGQITLELKNIGNKPIRLHAGVKICQIAFTTLIGEPMNLYGECSNHYQGQCGVQMNQKYPLIDNVYEVSENPVIDNQSFLEEF